VARTGFSVPSFNFLAADARSFARDALASVRTWLRSLPNKAVFNANVSVKMIARTRARSY
jgi:hypothetical protein